MRTSATFNWNPENLETLIKGTGISPSGIGEQIGLSQGRMVFLLNRRAKPTVDDLIAISKFFNVTIDYILGLSNEIGNNFPSYEKYIAHGGKPVSQTAGFESPWPFNILERIEDHPIDYVPSEDQIAGLDYIIDTALSPREKVVVNEYYRDRMTLDELSSKYSVTRERIRQILARAIRKLSHPSRKNYILFGKKKYDKMLRDKEKALYDEWCELNIKESQLLDAMDLSVRAYNCLKRSGCKNIDDVILKIENGSILDVRNIGYKSAVEVIDKVNKIKGTNYQISEVQDTFETYKLDEKARWRK